MISIAAAVAFLAVLVAVFRSRDESTKSRPDQSSQEGPVVYGYRVVQRYDHDPEAFTQGLLWLNGSLFESTGLYGESRVREVRLGSDGSSTIVRETRLKSSEFGEGLVHWRGELLQLLWRTSKGVRYSALAGPDGHLTRKGDVGFRTPFQDGWGLETDGRVLLVTDSGPDVFHLDPETFEQRHVVRVKDGDRVVEMVNELEFIEGELWSNLFGSDCLARINHETGQVLGWVDLTGILDMRAATEAAERARRKPPDILNGIAWDSSRRRLFVTGKLWPTLFEIEVFRTPTQDLDGVRSRCIPQTNIFRRR